MSRKNMRTNTKKIIVRKSIKWGMRTSYCRHQEITSMNNKNSTLGFTHNNLTKTRAKFDSLTHYTVRAELKFRTANARRTHIHASALTHTHTPNRHERTRMGLCCLLHSLCWLHDRCSILLCAWPREREWRRFFLKHTSTRAQKMLI